MPQTDDFLDAITAKTESNSRDRNADGSPVESPKGALWKMQVMPSTARDPGFGLQPANPDDPEDMNRLGREYRAAMEKKYGGDLQKMWAAYNAGPGRTNAAIAKHGDDWLSHMPSETRKYVRKNMAEAGKDSQGRPVGAGTPDRFLDGLESKLGPEKRASQNVNPRATKAYELAPQVNERAQGVEGDLQKQGQQIDVLSQAAEVAQATTRHAMTRQLAETRAISGEITSATERLKAKVTPVFQARSRVADQLDELATMNPIERGIRGIFDLNYDAEFLEGQLDQFDRTLAAREADFQYLNQLHGVALQEVNRRYNMETAMPDLMAAQAEEDLGITGRALVNSAQLLESTMGQIADEQQVVQAQALAREDLMLQLDTPTLVDLVGKAEQNGGIVSFNGVELSSTELRRQVQRSESQELEVEAYKMAVASGRMDYAQRYASNLLSGLTRSQLEGAIRNGGKWNGIQFNQGELTQTYQSAVSRDEERAAQLANNLPNNVALRTSASYLNRSVGLQRRGKALLGDAAMVGSNEILDRSADTTRRLIEAHKAGEPPEVITALTREVVSAHDEMNGFMSSQILKSVGGDKTSAAYVEGFLSGTPLSESAATAAMTHFVMKGALPQGVSVSPAAKQVFAKAQSLYSEALSSRAGGRKLNKDQIRQYVAEGIAEEAEVVMGQSRHDAVYSDLPGFAKEIGHPFGAFGAEKWGRIQSDAKVAAAEAIAPMMQTTPDVVLEMRDGRVGGREELLEKLIELEGAANAVEFQTVVTQLNNEQPLEQGRSNSDLLVELLGSGKFAQGLADYSNGRATNNMGEYLVGPLAAGAANQNFTRTREGILRAESVVNQTNRQLAQNPTTNMLFKPLTRTSMILKAIPGVGAPGAESLAPFVRQFYDEYQKNNFAPGVESPNARFVREDTALLAALKSTNFENPTAESYRKAAVSKWEEHATLQQGFIQRLIEGALGENPSIYDAEVGPQGVN